MKINIRTHNSIVYTIDCKYETQLLFLHEQMCEFLNKNPNYMPTIKFNDTPLDINFTVHFYGLLDNDTLDYVSSDGSNEHYFVKTEVSFVYTKKIMCITKNTTHDNVRQYIASDVPSNQLRTIVNCKQLLDESENIFELIKNDKKPQIILTLRLRGD